MATNCIIAAGPVQEVSWFIERARGPLYVNGKGPWHAFTEFSVSQLAGLLLPRERPALIPEMPTGSIGLPTVWETRSGLMRARWDLDDDALYDSDSIEDLLKGITRRYPPVVWVLAWENPDAFAAGSELYWRGRVRRYRVPGREFKRISREIYRQVGKPLGPGDEMDNPAADSLVDDALLDAAESFWDVEVERLLLSPFTRRRR